VIAFAEIAREAEVEAIAQVEVEYAAA